MRTPTQADITAAKRAAVERWGSDRCVLVEFQELDVALIVAPFDEASWDAYVDANVQHAGDAHSAAYAQRVLWPAPPEALAAADRWPALRQMVAAELHRLAGDSASEPVVERADASTVRWLEPAELERLRGDGTLWLVRRDSHGLCLLMRGPSESLYAAARDARAEAERSKRRIRQSTLQHCLSCVVWERTPVLDLLRTSPGLSSDLWVAFLRAGGYGAAVTTKSL